MPLDPVHLDGIDDLARRITARYADEEHEADAVALWEALDPLRVDGEVVVEPLDGLHRGRVAPEAIALTDDRFGRQYGVDSGTLNPRRFANGLTVDVAHAALAGVPSDLDLHRRRTVVTAVHARDATLRLDDDWQRFDDDHTRGRLVHVPSDLSAGEREAVHAAALYCAESRHLLDNLDAVAATDGRSEGNDEGDDGRDDAPEHGDGAPLVVLDGPVQPRGAVRWTAGDDALADSELADRVLRQYTAVVDGCVDRGLPLAGFVKNPASRGIVALLSRVGPCPWPTDVGFWRALLRPGSGADGDGGRRADTGGGAGADDGGEGPHLTFTNWFATSLFAEDDELHSTTDWTREPALDDGDYATTYMVVYDPRDDLVYRAEAPRAVTADTDVRERLTRQVLKEVALEGVPRAVGKADALARIGVDQKRDLVRALERALDTVEQRSYDDERWRVA